ncbi:MAG: hypothetical protein EXR62_07670 [Chloroflexi bacterium]|nr:hypothetical protein [Chloroflexota bacterium]
MKGVDFGGQLWRLVEQFGILDQEMASLAIRGQAIPNDPIVKYHIQRWVKQAMLTRSPKKHYKHMVYHLPGLRARIVSHNYRVAKLTHYLLVHTPQGKQITYTADSHPQVKPDAVLCFSGREVTSIFIEYQTTTEAWTTERKIQRYIDSDLQGVKLFFIERTEASILQLARATDAGDFCFANPDRVLASRTPWTDPLFYFGGGGNNPLPLLKPEK